MSTVTKMTVSYSLSFVLGLKLARNNRNNLKLRSINECGESSVTHLDRKVKKKKNSFFAVLQTKSSSSHLKLTQTVAHRSKMKSACVGARGCRLCSHRMDDIYVTPDETLTSWKNRGRTGDGQLLLFSNHFTSRFIHLAFTHRHFLKKIKSSSSIKSFRETFGNF